MEDSSSISNYISKNDSGSSVEDEGIGEEGTNVTNPIYKVSKGPGMLMNSSTAKYSKTLTKKTEYFDHNTDEFAPPYGEDDVSKRMKAVEFVVKKRGVNINNY